MDWFERITGFRERSGDDTRARLRAIDGHLVSMADGRRLARIGTLELPTLDDLRKRAAALAAPAPGTRTRVRCLAADVRALHADPAWSGALFQVASQFNLLEMIGPEVTPEQGVTRYQDDPTQGPACAIAAGAATIYRNDLVPLGDGLGQRADRQLNALAPMGEALSGALGLPTAALWTLRNGYALCTASGLDAIGRLLDNATPGERDRLRGRLAIGLHQDVEVTDAPAGLRTIVSQAFCSALPVAYGEHEPGRWAPFAQLVLEAAYEATLVAARARAAQAGSATVLLTRLGGGAFGNDSEWIDAAIVHALGRVDDAGLDVVLVDHGRVSTASRALAERWNAGSGTSDRA